MAERLASGGGELRRFVLESRPVRGHWVRLGQAWRELHAHQGHPPAVEALLGECVTAAVLLAATLKFQGTLTLQLAGSGCLGLLVAQCTHDFRLRGVARVDAPLPDDVGFRALVGAGRLTVTIEAEERAARYQGIVPLEGATLAASLENYFASSEQLPTRLMLAADAGDAAGLLLQQLPASGEAQAAAAQDAWGDLQAGMQQLPRALLLHGGADATLRSVFTTHDCRLYAAQPVRFECRCNAGRVAGMLRSLGRTELQALLAEQGIVSVTCEFCQRQYRFDAIDVAGLFRPVAGPAAPTLN
ncbi:MAG: Hsp33 family molecular chaperone HslO [Gammaproteobacteria bacterium]|nr:Hsp33 family molecular chaperone HslO [Gammaproteobacteria bacterium]